MCIRDSSEAFKYKTALVSCLYFLDVILKPLQRGQRTLEDLLSFSGNADLAVSLECSVQHIASCDIAHTGSLEDLTHFRVTDHFLLIDRIQHTLHAVSYTHRTGTVLSSCPVQVTEEEVREAVRSFTGEQLQIPPMYSALKVNGKKLYELAREGKEIERKARKVQFYRIELSLIHICHP